MLVLGTIGGTMVIYAIINRDPLWAIAGSILLHSAIVQAKTTIDQKFRLAVLKGVSEFLESVVLDGKED